MKGWWIVVFACGGSPPRQSSLSNHTSGAPQPAPGQITPEMFCERFVELRDGGCAPLQSVTTSKDECVAQMRSAPASSGAATFMDQAGQCIVGYKTCDEAMRCLAQLGPDHEHLRACDHDDPGKAVGMPKREWAARNGAGVVKFSQARSTKDKPIEVCTIDAEAEWLSALRCDDGSQPIVGHDAAEMARVGNVGQGGRCGSIIDLYRVKCPEALYELYVDGYVCPLPE
jgi:hypothetical protein